MVNIIFPYGFGQFRIFIIPVEHAAWLALFRPQHDFAYRAGLNGIALLVNQVHMVSRRRLAHGTWLRLGTHRVEQGQVVSVWPKPSISFKPVAL